MRGMGEAVGVVSSGENETPSIVREKRANDKVEHPFSAGRYTPITSLHFEPTRMTAGSAAVLGGAPGTAPH